VFGNVFLAEDFLHRQTNPAEILQALAAKLFWIWMLTFVHLA